MNLYEENVENILAGQSVLPVLKTLELHDVHVVAEKNAPAIIDTSHPDRKCWVFQS